MRGPKPKITVVGSFAVGLTLRAPRFPVKGETIIGSDFDIGPGGKGSNQAVGAARLGAESHLVAVIGTDIFGDMGVNLYRQEGVGIEHLRRTSERNTGVGFITLNAEGDNHIVLDMGANHLLSPADVDAAEDLIASSDVALSVLEINPATAARGMALARKHGVTSILNPAPAQPLDDSLLSQVDVLTPNESELRILCGLPVFRVRVIDKEHHHPFLAALRAHITRDGLHAFQRAGLEMGVAGGVAFPEALLDRAVHAEDRQRCFEFGAERMGGGMLQQLREMRRADAFVA